MERGRGGEREHTIRIIIQLSLLCGAELTRTGADFLLLTHPSVTSPCRERERERETDRERKREEPILTTTRITANQEKKTVSFESRQSTFTHTTAQLQVPQIS